LPVRGGFSVSRGGCSILFGDSKFMAAMRPRQNRLSR
jgi:hypothetical protein